MVYDKIKDKLEWNEFRSPLTINAIDIFPIVGEPWINDLSSPRPYFFIRLELFNKALAQDPELEQNLYKIFRKFGKISTITVQDRAMKDNKPLICQVTYAKLPSAIAARICLNQANFFDLLNPNSTPSSDESGKLIINYEPFNPTGFFSSYYSKHPRIVGLAIGIMLATLSFTIIDPLRKVFIWLKLTSKTSINEKKGINQIVTYSYKLLGLFGLGRFIPREIEQIDIGLPQDSEGKLKSYLKRSPENILYLTGPYAKEEALLLV